MKIFVAAHNDAPLIRAPHLFPIMGGSAFRQHVPDGYLRDDTGDNISKLNKYFCEMTIHYWIWKNISDNIIGLCHYRRYFVPAVAEDIKSDIVFDPGLINYISSGKSQDDMIHALGSYELIVPSAKDLRSTIKDHYITSHAFSDWVALKHALDANCPSETSEAMQYFRKQTNLHSCNMFVGHSKTVQSYYAWIFPILSTFYNVAKQRNSPYLQRAPGFIAERLFNWWLYSRKPKFRTSAVFFLGEPPEVKQMSMSHGVKDTFGEVRHSAALKVKKVILAARGAN